MTHLYIYRGVTYKKQADENITVKNDRIEKVYRGTAYLKLPKVKQRIAEHMYRGVQFAS